MTRNTDPDEAENEKYSHGASVGPTGPTVTRRRVLQTIGAAGAAAALGTGTVAADHGSEDPIAVDEDDVESGELEDTDPVRVAAGTAAGGALMAGPAGAVVAGAAGYSAAKLENEHHVVGNFLYGDYEDRINTQLQADIHSHASTVSNENSWSLKQFDNRLEVSKNNWIAQAKFAQIQALNNDANEATVVADGIDAVLEAAATVQENLLAIESAGILRYASFDAKENVADVTGSDQVTQPGAHATGEDMTVEGVKPLHVTLVNGDTVEAWGLHIKHTGTDAGTVERVIHSHAANVDIVGTSQPDIPLDSGATKLHELVEEFTYNADAGRVEYTDPETGATMRTTEPMSGDSVDSIGGNTFTRVYHPDNVGLSNDQVVLYDQGVVGELSDTSGTNGLAGYWTHNAYPLISTVANEIETLGHDIYAGIESGQIDVSDLMTPSVYAENLARDWATSGSTGYSKALLANLGIDSSLETSMAVTVADNTDPSTTLSFGDIGQTAEFSTSLSAADADVTVAFDPGGAADGSGTMQVPAGTETANVRVSPYTDDPDAPAYAVQSVDLTTAAGDTVTVQVAGDSSVDGTVATGEAWYSDLDADGDGSVTVSDISVTYATTADDGTTSETTDTVVTGAGLAISIGASSVAWTYQDAALSTDWRPHGGTPESWSDAATQKFTFTGTELTNTSGPDSVDATVSFDHDGSPVTNDSAPDTYTVPSDRSVNVSLSGTITNVDAVTVTTTGGTTATATIDSEGFAAIPHSDFGAAGETYVIDTVDIEYTDPSDGTAYTQNAGTVNAELSVENVEIPEYDFMVQEWYHTDNKGSDDNIVICTTDGKWVDVEAGDVFRIESATDAEGNELDGVTLSDTNRHTLNVDRVEEEVRRSIETQKTIEQTTDDPVGGGGGGGGSTGVIGLIAAAVVGGGALKYLSGGE